MGIFSKKSADPEREFVVALNDCVRAARKGGVAKRVVMNNLRAHAASIDRELSAEIERRKYGDPVMRSGNLE
jgi:hypothetical protein